MDLLIKNNGMKYIPIVKKPERRREFVAFRNEQDLRAMAKEEGKNQNRLKLSRKNSTDVNAEENGSKRHFKSYLPVPIIPKGY